jgi:hypothetical protein
MCMICCQYQKKQQNTQWRCGRCRMPMCKKKRRDVTCFQEHCEMIGNPVLGCGPCRIHFALPTEHRKCKSRTEMLEEQPAYNHHFEDEAGSEKSKLSSAAAGGKGKSNRPWRGGSTTNYSTTSGLGEHDSPLSFTEEAGDDSYNDSISSSGSESSSSSSSNDRSYRVWWDKKQQAAAAKQKNPPEERKAASKRKTPLPVERPAPSKWKSLPERSRRTDESDRSTETKKIGPGWLRPDNGFRRHIGAALYTPPLIQPAKHSRKMPTPEEIKITRSRTNRTATPPAPASAQQRKGRATSKTTPKRKSAAKRKKK